MVVPSRIEMELLKRIYKLLDRKTATITITKAFTIDVGHRIWNQSLPDGMECKCVQLHGHTTKIQITIAGPFDRESGMIIDFNIINPIIEEFKRMFDHKTLIHKDDPEVETLRNLPGVVVIEFVPTAENLALFTMEFFNERLKSPYKCTRVRWYETPTAWAEVNAPAS